MKGCGVTDRAMRALTAGSADGEVLVLAQPLSFWGGLDLASGRLIDVRHPQVGAEISGRILVMPAGRGSSSSSYVLAEAIRSGTAPAAIVTREPDPILALGSIVAAELYGREVPVLVADERSYAALRTGTRLRIEAAGGVATTVTG